MNDLMTDSFGDYADLKIQEECLHESTAAADPDLLCFLGEAEAAKQEIAAIQDNLTRLHHAPDTETLKSLRGRITAVRGRIDSMGRRPGPAPIAASLRAKLRDLILQFQDMRDRMAADRKAAVRRCYFTITGEEPSDEVVERMAASKGEGEEDEDEAVALFRKAIEEGGVRKMAEEMEKREVAAKEVERSLVELHQVFLDMAVVVETQGERVDEIAYLVVEAAQGIGDGAEELEEARRYQRSNRRKWVWIGVVVLVVILVIVVVAVAIVVVVSGKSSGNLLLPIDPSL